MKGFTDDFGIRAKLKDIFGRLFNVDTSLLNGDLLDENLLGSKICLKPRDLLCLFFEIEKEFSIVIEEEDIVNERFNTFNSIATIIEEQEYKKEEKV